MLITFWLDFINASHASMILDQFETRKSQIDGKVISNSID